MASIATSALIKKTDLLSFFFDCYVLFEKLLALSTMEGIGILYTNLNYDQANSFVRAKNHDTDSYTLFKGREMTLYLTFKTYIIYIFDCSKCS